MKSYTVEVNGEAYELRLTSSDVMELENKWHKSIFDMLKDNYSITTIVTMFQYMIKGRPATLNVAKALYDGLVEEGYSFLDISKKVVMPVLVQSGLIKESDVEDSEKNVETVQ